MSSRGICSEEKVRFSPDYVSRTGTRDIGTVRVRHLYIWRDLSLADEICSNSVFSKDDALIDNEGFKRKI